MVQRRRKAKQGSRLTILDNGPINCCSPNYTVLEEVHVKITKGFCVNTLIQIERMDSIANLAQRLEQELPSLARKWLNLKQVTQLVKLRFVEPQKVPAKTLQIAT